MPPTRSLSLDFALRYLRRPADRLISAVGLVSVLGLVVGVMSLVISMALMTGYRYDLQRKLLGGNAEVFVYPLDGPIDDLEGLLGRIRQAPGVSDAYPSLFQQALISSEELSTGREVMIKGIDPRRAATTPLLSKIIGPTRSLAAGDQSSGVAVGKYLAARLGVKAGSQISLTVPSVGEANFLPKSGSFMVTNVFDSGFYDFDARWVFLEYETATSLLGPEASANMVEVKTAPKTGIDDAVASVAAAAGQRYATTDWRQMNQQLFSMLEKQQIVLFLVFGLIVFVSTFNIVSTLIMTVHEKRREIGILVSMGAEQRLIRRIFVWYGTLVGATGTIIGLALGVVVCWIITRFELVSFGPEISEVYFVSSIPFITRPVHLLVIGAFTILVSFAATLIPSARAARLNPVDALRHE